MEAYLIGVALPLIGQGTVSPSDRIPGVEAAAPEEPEPVVYELEDEPAAPDEPDATRVHDAVPEEPGPVEENSPAAAAAPEERHDEPEPVHPEPAGGDEREYIPLAPEQPVSHEPHTPAPEEPQRAGARTEDVVAALLPAVAIPVIVTSIAGWRFGLPFVALSVIATGWLLSRHGGISTAWRRSPAAGTILKTTAAVTVLSAVAAIVLASVGKDDSSTNSDKSASPPAKKPAEPSTASKPATTTPAKPARRKKPRTKAPTATQPSTPPPTTPAEPTHPSNQPPPDPDTQGLIRVPPSQAAQTPTTPSTTPPPPGTQTTP